MCEAASQNIHDLHKVVRASTEATTIRNTLAAISPIFCSVGRTKIDRSAEIHTHLSTRVVVILFPPQCQGQKCSIQIDLRMHALFKAAHFSDTFFSDPNVGIPPLQKKNISFFGGKCFYPNLDRFIFVALQINGY